MELKIGDLVLVTKGEHKGLKGNIHNIDGDRVFITRVQRDLDKGLLPAMGDWHVNSVVKIYKDDELRYAAYATCDCGAGLAYPKDLFDIRGSWECSDILTGRAKLDKTVTHSAPKPFIFYEIKSEDQPSANGATTRQQTYYKRK